MTTFAPQQDVARRLRELDQRARRAWIAYSKSLRDLEGRAYEDAEANSWQRLQRQLAELDDERAELVRGRGAGADEH